MRKLLGVGVPGEPATVETLLGEMEVIEDPAAVAAIVAEVRKTQLRFGAALPSAESAVVACAGLRRSEHGYDPPVRDLPGRS